MECGYRTIEGEITIDEARELVKAIKYLRMLGLALYNELIKEE